MVNQMIRDQAYRVSLGAALRKAVLADHSGAGWQRRVNEVYAELTGSSHRSRTLPVAECVETAADVGLSSWQSYRSSGPGPLAVADELRTMLVERAYYCRQDGDYRGSLAILRLAGRRCGWDRRTSSAAAKLLPHWMRYGALGQGHKRSRRPRGGVTV
jgi:hypothetical protein